jgi:hypothetical protein
MTPHAKRLMRLAGAVREGEQRPSQQDRDAIMKIGQGRALVVVAG